MSTVYDQISTVQLPCDTNSTLNRDQTYNHPEVLQGQLYS